MQLNSLRKCWSYQNINQMLESLSKSPEGVTSWHHKIVIGQQWWAWSIVMYNVPSTVGDFQLCD